ncbi:UDP-N-acetylglucosamine 1-carboxyvinyltransferase [Gracilibacillus sp. HCP3S3_G5_1]|uniref:UDP-N-acetylglucosamine 1-carboxyvinyltransferase n=1 Tax=unclassified Gracilibacillus TaxID=2625209 RepID=UPI003F8A9B01
MKESLISNIENVLVDEPYLEINGGYVLEGTTEISGAKNAALPAIVAACLSDEEVTLQNVPLELNDVKLIIKLLKNMGASIKVNTEEKVLICSGVNWRGGSLDSDLAGKIRHSLLLLGLAANRKTDIFLPMPGGCDLGNRKHDMHVNALRSLGNTVIEDEGILLKPGKANNEALIEFYYPTFGGTLNAIFASVCLKESQITIKNAARNPEVLDVINLLNRMGASIAWSDERTLNIKGAEKLKGTDYSVMPDRIIAATVIAATAITNGDVYLNNFDSNLLATEIGVWRQSGVIFEQDNNGLRIRCEEGLLNATSIETKAYPGFHTDIQPLHTLMMALANGESTVKETILNGRFKYCVELVKMGANIQIYDTDFYCVNGAKGQIAKIKGVNKLYPAVVKATDIRGGAAVAVAGLAANGVSKITNIYQLERGYGNFVELFNSLGADIKRVS